MIKKALVSFAMMLAVGTGLLFAGGTEASATTKTLDMWWEHEAYIGSPIQHRLTTSDSGSSVNVSVVQGDMKNGYSANGAHFTIKMDLQRYTGGVWKTIGTRSGYVEWNDPMHRTFTDIATNGTPIRVKLTVDALSSPRYLEWTR